MRNVLDFLFPKTNALKVARSTLAAAEIDLLNSEYHAEHYTMRVIMVKERIDRLNAYIAARTECRKDMDFSRQAKGGISVVAPGWLPGSKR